MASYRRLVERLELLSCRYSNKPKNDLLREIYGLLLAINENGQDANHLRVLMIDLENNKGQNEAEKQKEIEKFLTSVSDLYKRFDFRKRPLHVGILNYLIIFLIATAAAVAAEAVIRFFFRPT